MTAAPWASSQRRLARAVWLITIGCRATEFRAKEAPQLTVGMFARYKTACPQSREGDAARCILRRLQKQNNIRIFFVRYDEGTLSQTTVNLEKELERSSHR